MNKPILLLDNYDSFTYNLYHLVRELGYRNIEVFRNDAIRLDEISAFDRIILSPGPGIPSEAGLLTQIISRYASTIPMLGVCLGHQAIAEVFGAKLLNLKDVFHGVATPVQVVKPHILFEGLGSRFEAGRYHSWIVANHHFPAELEVTAIDETGSIMALRHKQYDLHGIQFHPESVLTPLGARMMQNWLSANAVQEQPVTESNHTDKQLVL